MFRSRGFLICSDNLLMFILRLLNPWCSHVLAAKPNSLVRTEALLTRTASWLIWQLLPTFFSIIKRFLSDTHCFQEAAFRIHKQRLSQCSRFILIENIKESSCWFIQKSSHEIPQMIYSSSLGVLGLSAFYPPRCLQSVCWATHFTITAEIMSSSYLKKNGFYHSCIHSISWTRV